MDDYSISVRAMHPSQIEYQVWVWEWTCCWFIATTIISDGDMGATTNTPCLWLDGATAASGEPPPPYKRAYFASVIGPEPAHGI